MKKLIAMLVFSMAMVVAAMASPPIDHQLLQKDFPSFCMQQTEAISVVDLQNSVEFKCQVDISNIDLIMISKDVSIGNNVAFIRSEKAFYRECKCEQLLYCMKKPPSMMHKRWFYNTSFRIQNQPVANNNKNS